MNTTAGVGIVAALSLLAGVGFAQNTPDWEVSGGYRYVRAFDPSPVNASGFSAAAQENMNSWFGAVVEAGASFQSQPAIRNQLVTFMFGPQLTSRKSSRLQPFVRAMIGGARVTVTDGPSGTGLALDGGAGADVRMAANVFLRINADFLRTAVSGQVQKDVQAGVGIVYCIGRTNR